ncbi:MAG: DNA translocase FtsK, partial [Campylobacteraceae bacterium]|nr:DNA translocase FtsK [Campylobacteraceae bacterium]
MVYICFSTILPDPNTVGIYGSFIGIWNKKVFGLFSFVYPIILVVILLFYKFPKIDARKIEISLSFVLLFFSILMLQAVIFSNYVEFRGICGFAIVEILSSLIGIYGVVICIIALFTLALLTIFDINFEEFISFIKKLINRGKINFKNSVLGEDISTQDEFDLPSYIRKGKKDVLTDENKDTPLFGDFNEPKVENKKLSIEDRVRLITKKPKSSAKNDAPFYIEEIKSNDLTIEKYDNYDDGDIDIDENTDLDDSLRIIKKASRKIEILNEIDENKKLLSQIDKGTIEKPKGYQLPPLSYLSEVPKKTTQINEVEIDRKISDLLEKLRRFKIDGDVVRTYAGPVVTTFEFKPAPHVKVSKILTLQDDLAMALMAQTIRIQAPVPGKDVIGIEIPNKNTETIYLREILESDIFKHSSSQLTIALGKDIVGNSFITDLKKLPHLLIAGTTGSGKSVGINAMLVSLLYRNSPDTLRLLMIDPKMLEFSIYNDIPHLLTPVITQSKQAIIAL